MTAGPGAAGEGGDMPGATTKAQQAERLAAIRLRYTINTHLDDRGLTTPAATGAALGLPSAEAVSLLTRRQWREGDVAALQAVADRLRLAVPPLEGFDLLARQGRVP